MKIRTYLLFVALIVANVLIGQTVYTSIADGSYRNNGTWSIDGGLTPCSCQPPTNINTGDSIVIKHEVFLPGRDLDIINGSVTVDCGIFTTNNRPIFVGVGQQFLAINSYVDVGDDFTNAGTVINESSCIHVDDNYNNQANSFLEGRGGINADGDIIHDATASWSPTVIWCAGGFSNAPPAYQNCSAAVCNCYNKLRFSDGTGIAEGDVFALADLPGSTYIEVSVNGTFGNVEIELSGPVNFTDTLTSSPYVSQTFTPLEGLYTLTIRIYETLGNGGGLCEERTIQFFIGEDPDPDFTEDGTTWGVDTDMSKDGGLAFGDYDNDGDLDLIVNTDDNTVRSRLYRNNNDYTFTDVTAALSPYMLTTTRERAAVWGDLNNDGWLDYLRNTSTAGIEVYIQETGGGVFGDGTGGTTPLIFNSSNISDGVNTEGAGMLDFDGDGDLDIIFDNHNFGIDVLRNNYVNHLTGAVVNPASAGLFTHATPGTSTILGLSQSATDGDYGSFTDVNDDGWVDIFMRKRDENDFFLNQGGVFSNGADLAQAENSNKGAVNLYDYDNDGDFDAYWTENDVNQIFRNDNGTWVPLGSATGIPTSFTGGNNIDEVASGDIDNDGDIDLLLVGDDRSYLYLNQLNDPIFGKNYGTPMTFELVPNLEFHAGEDGEGAIMIDIDNDGDLDIYINVENEPNQLYLNDLYTASTLAASKKYLFVEVIDDRSEYMQAGAERMALGATVVLEDCDGNVISGLRELNGGNGHGTQDPPIVHFGLPDGPDFDYRVVVKYPNWINASGDTVRQEVSKWIRPSHSAVSSVSIEFRPSDSDIGCPMDFCETGADTDADGIRDVCDIDDDNDGILDEDEGHICETLDISSLDGTINSLSDFNAEQINIAGAIIQIEDPLTFGGSASVDEFGVNDDHETGSYGFQLGVNSFGSSDYLETHYSFSKDVCNFNARILDIDVSDALDISGFLDGVAVTYMITYQGSCVAYDGINTFSSTCLVNSNPGAGNVDDHAINIEFNSCIDSMAIRIYENGAGSGGSYTFVLSPDPTCTYRDTDDDGITDHLDLDSDNDGIYDLIESGHLAVDANGDGIIDGASSTFGANGLFDGLETLVDNGIINYTISDSEASPDGIYDPYELDADGDGCYDAREEDINDPDNDGQVDTGTPVVLSNGLVSGYVYGTPPNNFWQDPSQVFCSFVCRPDIYMATSTGSSVPSQLYTAGTLSSPITLNPIGANTGSNYNAMGYRTQDNFLYAIILETNELIRIDSSGIEYNLGPITGLPAPAGLGSSYDGGDVFPDGYLYIHEVGSHDEIYQIDVSAVPPVLIATHTLSQNVWLSDYAYNINDNKVYGVGDQGDKYMIDPSTWTVTTIGTNAPAASYGAAYTDDQGNVFVYRNNPGAFFEVDFGFNGTGSGDMTFISTGPNVSFNDGASCRGTIFIPELCGNGTDDDGDGIIDCATIAGRVYEDLNYGGGSGRNYNMANASAVASGWVVDEIGVDGVTVELYDNADVFLRDTVTDVNGNYAFEVKDQGNYFVRVVNGTVSSNRGTNSLGVSTIPVQTFRTDGVIAFINEVGGADPDLIDANANSGVQLLSALSTATREVQSVSDIVIGSTNVGPGLITLDSPAIPVDFGFNFDVIVNTNNTGQGSIRQFILNSNELDNSNLDQEDNPPTGENFIKPPGTEHSIFMIGGIGVHRITPTSVLPSIVDDYTHITGYTQEGSSQGSIATRTNTIEINGNTVLFDGININANYTTISGLVINDFRTGLNGTIARSNAFIWGNYIGTTTDGLSGLGNSSLGLNLQNFTSSFIGTNGDGTNDVNEGNLVSDNSQGIQIRNGNGILIAGNIVGLDKDGIGNIGNTFNGIYIRDATGPNVIGFDDNAISNTVVHFRNISSGNGNDGVRMDNSSNQTIAGNYLGTDVSGTIDRGNTNYGVQISGSSSNNFIGTDSDGNEDASETNVLSGNGSGLRFLPSGSGTNNRIAGNYIGVDASGNIDLGNQTSGVELNGGYTGTIIGTNGDNVNDVIERNVISGNVDDGIRIASSNNHIVAGNYIGIGADGTTPIPNDKRGILLTLTTSNTTIGYSPTMANSDELVVGNIIKYNGDAGIGHSGSGTQNRYSRNQLENNGALGIDLGYDGVTSNDNGDGDAGANNLYNFPMISSVMLLNDNLTITGFAPAGSEIEFFIADAGPNPSPLPAAYTRSFGEGSTYLFTVLEGSAQDNNASIGTYNNDGAGIIFSRTQNRYTFTINVATMGLTEGMFLSATATDSNNNTSEFSNITEILVNCGTARTNPHIMYYRR